MPISYYTEALSQIINYSNFLRGDKLELHSEKEKQIQLEKEYKSIFGE